MKEFWTCLEDFKQLLVIVADRRVSVRFLTVSGKPLIEKLFGDAIFNVIPVLSKWRKSCGYENLFVLLYPNFHFSD
jgi:hypothetical protein